MRRWTAGLIVMACAVPRMADAFLLVGKAAKASSDETTVVALREGRRTVLAIQPTYRGPTEPVALILPVPASVTASGARTMAREPVEKLEKIAAPRLAEYWEQDPCESAPDLLPRAAAPAPPGDAPSAPLPPPGAAGSYDIEILQARTGAEAVKSLRGDGYRVPDSARDILNAYLEAGQKLLVARLDVSKLPEGTTRLPVLSVDYESAELTFPVRLFAARTGRHELRVHVLGSDRFEAAQAPNMGVPTNLDVTQEASAELGAFYAALLDRTYEKNPGAVVTEYAWRASTCDMCPAPLSEGELVGLGTGRLPSAASGKQQEVLIEADEALTSRIDGPPSLRAKLDECYGKALATEPRLAGEVAVAVKAGADGKVVSADVKGSPAEVLARCATDAIRATTLDKAGGSGVVSVKFVPMSRAFYASLVHTSLRARYEKAPDQDLSLKPARAIEGGREDGSEGDAVKKVYVAEEGNNYEPRYAVRHPFTGDVKCESPERGVWGPTPPAGTRKDTTPKKAAAGRGGLETWVEGQLPDFSAFAIHFGPPAPPAPAPPPEAPAAPPPAPAPSAPPSVETSRGCDGCAAAPSEGTPIPAALLALSVLALRRRSRRSTTGPLG